MGRYASKPDLNFDDRRLVELTERSSAVGVPDDGLIDQLIEDDAQLIDDKLKKVYVTPFAAPVPPMVRRINVKLSRRSVITHREGMEVPKHIEDDYKWAIAELEKIVQEKYLEAPLAQAATPPATDDGLLEPDEPRVFGRGRDGLG